MSTPPDQPQAHFIPSESARMTLWMGDLEPWMDEPFLRQLWTSIGEAVIVKLIRDKRTNSSLGYAFIGFPSPVAAQRALATVHGTKMPKSQRNFRLNWAAGGGILDKKEERAPEYSLFVGDLSNDVDETYLLAMFRQRYASCHSAKVMTDPISGLSRGYGFVRFHDPQEQLMALTEMNGVVCGQRHIRISLATPKTNANAAAHLATSPAMSPPDSVYHPSTTMPSFHSPMPYLSPHLSPTLSSSPPSALLPPPSDSANQVARYFQLALQAPALVQQPTDPSNTTVFIGGLSTPISEEELLQYFNPFGEITYVKIPPGKGCGFVQYISRASAETAIERMNGFQIGQSRIRLSWGRSQHDKMPTSTNSLSNTLLMSAPSASTSSSSTSTNNDHPLLGNPPHPSSFHPYAYASTHPPPVPNPAFSLSPLSSSSSSTSSYLPYYHTPLSPTLASPLESSSHSQPFSLLRHAYDNMPPGLLASMPPTTSSLKAPVSNGLFASKPMSPPASFSLQSLSSPSQSTMAPLIPANPYHDAEFALFSTSSTSPPTSYPPDRVFPIPPAGALPPTVPHPPTSKPNASSSSDWCQMNSIYA